jgi:hypothetical protein
VPRGLRQCTTLLDCGGKRSATPLYVGRSGVRIHTALRKRRRRSALPAHSMTGPVVTDTVPIVAAETRFLWHAMQNHGPARLAASHPPRQAPGLQPDVEPGLQPGGTNVRTSSQRSNNPEPRDCASGPPTMHDPLGLRWQAQRDTALRRPVRRSYPYSPAKAPSPLRSAGALHDRTHRHRHRPNRCSRNQVSLACHAESRPTPGGRVPPSTAGTRLAAWRRAGFATRRHQRPNSEAALEPSRTRP